MPKDTGRIRECCGVCVCVEAGDWRIMKDGREANNKILVRQKEREQTEKKRLISRGEKGKRKGPNLQTTKRKIKEQFPFFFSSRMVDEESPQPRFIVQPEGRVYTCSTMLLFVLTMT